MAGHPNQTPWAAVQSWTMKNVRDALRSVAATPVVTAVAIASLALGIGANTALFSILNGLLLKQLPVREPQRLALLGETEWTNPIWEKIRDRQADFAESACAWAAQQFNLAASGRAEPVDGAYVSGDLFRTLGVDTIVGRPLTAADDVRGGGADGWAAVISERLWRSRFGGSPDILGRQLIVKAVPFTIVGVTPRGFFGPEVGRAMDVFVPLASEAAIRGPESALDGRSSWWLQVMVRLKREQTLASATTALNRARPAIRDATMPPNYTAEYRAQYLNDDNDFRLIPGATGQSPLRGRFQQPLTIIMIVVATVLLIACANIANLMLARGAARRHEMSVRLALGASRARLGVQLFTESLVLAIAGGVCGLALAEFLSTLLLRQLATDVSTIALNTSFDWHVLGFTAAVALGATLLFGLAPALRIGSVEPNEALKEHSRTIAGDRRIGLRHVLVVAQVAFSFVLIAGAGLFVRTFTTLLTTPLGFDPAKLLIVNVDASRSNAALAAKAAFARHVADVAAEAPGVSKASLSYLTPLSGRNWTHRVEVSGGPVLSRAEQTAWVNAVAPGWFETYRMRLIAGRDVAISDKPGSEAVVVVNEAFVRRFVGARSPLGLRVRGLGLGKLKECVIVGVVSDAIYRTVRVGVVPTMYLPMAQADPFGFGFSVTARVSGDRASAERNLTDALSRVDPDIAFSFRDYADQLRATMVEERLVAILSGFFGALALLLGALGLYGVTSYSVSRRRPEIAVRIALGATSASIMRRVLQQVAMLVVIGGAIGFGLSFWAARFVTALLFGVSAHDSATLAAAAAVLVTVGLFAAWLPARSASRLNPVTILRG